VTEGHSITIAQSAEHARVVREGQVLAENTRHLVLRETVISHAVPLVGLCRVAVPRGNSRCDLWKHRTAEASDGGAAHRVRDPHALPVQGHGLGSVAPRRPDLVWAYPAPKPEVAEVKGHLCFDEVEVV
jgi:Domain of unknown function (DUF427)